ncbi:putative PAB-dependent poly(A)-specific ribonuclease subunit PAN2 [Triangularia verruculosa]|uniref:PAN2-PAN3 deadenylation complex catalytic subunit PAN2 n=1 Tax=Triangularia verruculosa TaxID=2587418 RepID=A0AAN6XFP8_9PEZI|nr:putative PAB-dependent poly(A)-specific ribonuclease subunit PAN2 [Triangularia verruculosa]
MANYFSDWTPQVNRITFPVPLPNDFKHPPHPAHAAATHPAHHPAHPPHHGSLHPGGQPYGPPPPGIGGVGVGGGLKPATALAFDPQAELLWAGDWKGRVSSFANRELQRYTAFKIQTDPNDGPVQQFLFHDKGVIVLGRKGVHMAMRRGPALWNIRHEGMTDLRCMSFTSKGASEILVAGWQDTMFVIDVVKGEVTKQVPAPHHYKTMKRGRYICAATETGRIDIMNPTTFKVEKEWQAHQSYINDMDASGDYIVTCGGSYKQQGPGSSSRVPDPYVNVYDLRNMTSIQPMPFPPLAAYVRLHPRMLTTTIVSSQQGQMHVVDIMNPNTTNIRYAHLQASINLFEIAPSGRALVIADNDRNIALWGSPADGIQFTNIGAPITFPEPEEPAPHVDWGVDTPLSSIGMPFYYGTMLFSAWPADIISDAGAPPPQFDPNFINTLTKAEWGYYGPNKTGLRRNQIEDTRAAKATNKLQAPKFLSERARDGPMPDNHADQETLAQDAAESLKPEPPPIYGTLEIKYSRFGVDDFDFGFFNKTKYAGLENQIPNSYANSLLQVMNYTPLIRNMALQHVATSCVKDLCLLCELGFVFDMLQKAEGLTCHATNLFKTITGRSESQPLDLLEEDHHSHRVSTATGGAQTGPLPHARVQNLCRFLMDQTKTEYQSIQPISTALERQLLKLPDPPSPEELTSKLLTTSAVVNINCTNCRTETTRTGAVQVIDLIYPPPRPAIRNARAPRTTFSQVLKMGVEKEVGTKGWCGNCKRYQTLQLRKTIQSVPAVLTINTAMATHGQQENRKLWATPGWLPEEIGVIVSGGQFFCYEGEDLRVHLQRGAHDITVYSLMGMVVNIEHPPPQKPHLVAMVNVAHSEPTPPTESKWHLFNDFSVRRVSSAEALTFNAAWKLPSVLMYQIKQANNRSNSEWKTRLDTSILYKDLSPHLSEEERTYRLLEKGVEDPGPGTIAGLDTEYVSLKDQEIQINSNGEKETLRPMWLALGRVSVIRAQGEGEGEAFIDDWITIREPVHDYLTQYSGITAGDLDARTSKHTLVTLKTAYRKIWTLLNLGVTFLGHGLRQDFRVMNIHVPRAQVIDTAVIYHLSAWRRVLSLSVLSRVVLREKIQQGQHDSVEDAVAALRLYRKYQEYVDAGLWEREIEGIYMRCKAIGFNAKFEGGGDNGLGGGQVKRTDTPPTGGGVGEKDGVAGPTTPVRKAAVLGTASASAMGSVGGSGVAGGSAGFGGGSFTPTRGGGWQWLAG